MSTVTATDLNSDVQAELREYMQAHELNRMFAAMVEAVLLEQPKKPQQFLVNYLLEKFEADIDLAALGLRRTEGRIGGSSRATGGAGGSSEFKEDGKGPEGDESGESSGSDSDDDDDEHETVEELPKFSLRTTNRRISVSAESNVDPRMLKAQWEAERKVYAKTDDEKRRLRGILHENLLFRKLDDDQMEIILDALCPMGFHAGKTVIKQGAPGDLFYVVESGTPEVFVETNGVSKKVASYKQGDSFGELALMYNAPRAASVVTADDCKLWALDRLTFKVILMDTTMNKRKRYEAFLSKVPLLSTLSDYERATIADALVVEEFQKDQVICMQDEPGDKFYIVERGEVSITRRTSSSAPAVEVDRCTPGAYFGEIALLTNQPRKATATAKIPTLCLSLDRKTFARVMGPLSDILKRNMSRYEAVMSQLEEA